MNGKAPVTVDAASLKALDDLVQRLKKAQPVIRTELAAGMTRAAEPVQSQVRKSAASILPKGGGLAAWVAGLQVQAQATTSGARVGIRFVATLAKKKGGTADLAAINKGQLFHPAWGRPRKGGGLIPQRVPSGFLDSAVKGPIQKKAQTEILAAMQRAARRIVH